MNVTIFTIHDNLDSTYSRHDIRRKATKNEPQGKKSSNKKKEKEIKTIIKTPRLSQNASARAKTLKNKFK